MLACTALSPLAFVLMTTDWSLIGYFNQPMATVPASKAKTKLGELLDRVLEGEEIIITRHEKPLARLIAEGGPNLRDIERAAEGLKSVQKKIAASSQGKKPVTWKEFRSFVEAGRR
jgi:prevent-host-death family protein